MHMSKLNKLYTLNILSLLYLNYMSIKLPMKHTHNNIQLNIYPLINYSKKSLKILNVGENEQKLEPSYIACGNAKRYTYY